MNDFPHRPLSPAGTMRRRELLARAAQMGIALPALGALGAACGSSSSSPPPSSSGPPKGTAVLLNYQGWMGKHTVADFEQAYPGAGIKQASLGSISSGAVVPQIKANMSTYDAALGDQAAHRPGHRRRRHPAAGLVEDPQHQERRPEVPVGLHARHPHRLRQDRHRLSHRHGL